MTYRNGPVPESILHGGPPARDILYRDVAKWYLWKPRNKVKDINAHWKRRIRFGIKVVGRIRHVSPTMECKELFHLRLLLNTKRGPTSFEDLRTIDGVTYTTFHEAAFAMGLVEDDREWEIVMEESSVVASSSQMRSLFVIILTHGMPMNPSFLWDKYKNSMSEDFMMKRVHRNPSLDREVIEDDYNLALLDIESQLQVFPKSRTTDYNLPATKEPPVPVEMDSNSEIRNALSFDPDVEKSKMKEFVDEFNDEQRGSFDEINQSVIDGSGKCFFLDGAGGCGKTYVAKALIHATRSRRQIAIACASSGIASTLLPKGQTAHSAFSIPIEGLNPDSTCNITGLSGKAKLIRRIALIVWDEAFMVHRHGFEATSRTLQHLRNDKKTAFGGITVLILGDLRQTLPVLPKASRVQIVDSCLTRSRLWKSFKRLTLQINMRVMTTCIEDRQKLLDYDNFLIKLGDGKILSDETGGIQLPSQFSLPPNDPRGIVKWVYGDKPRPLPVVGRCPRNQYKRILKENIEYYKDKAILCPKNEDVDKLNETIMKTLPGEGQVYLSADAVSIGDVNSDEGLHVTTEFLNSINLSGLPPHVLTVKVGVVMMLLRNLNPKKGYVMGPEFSLHP